MIIIKKKEKDTIDRMLKEYKRKSIRYGVINEVKSRKEFVKSSVKKRQTRLNAIFYQMVKTTKENNS
jgi:small subunit ribosomal protein S21